MFFILKIFPDWFWWFLLIAGLSGYFLSYLVPAKAYSLLLKILAAITVAVTIFVFGTQYSNNHWQQLTQELTAKLQVAEAKSAAVNTVVETKTITKIQVIKENAKSNQTTLRETAAAQLDAGCALPVSSVVLHNSASQGTVATGPASTDGTSSGVEASALLETVIDNYSACYNNAIKLQAWQTWYQQQKAIYEEVQQ